MEPIKLNKATTELKEQLTFLIRCEIYNTYNKYYSPIFYLLVWTLLLTGLLVSTGKNDLMVLKVVSIFMTAMTWIIFIPIIVIMGIKRLNRNIWVNKTVRNFFKADTIFYFSFDNEKLYFKTEMTFVEMNWDYYKYYVEYNKSIFILPEKNLYESLYYSQNELGNEAYGNLKDIAKTKLVSL